MEDTFIHFMQKSLQVIGLQIKSTGCHMPPATVSKMNMYTLFAVFALPTHLFHQFPAPALHPLQMRDLPPV